MNSKQRQDRIKILETVLQALEGLKAEDGSLDWEKADAVEGSPTAEHETEDAKAEAVVALYDELKTLNEDEDKHQKTVKRIREATVQIRDRNEPVVTSAKEEWNFEKAAEGVMSGKAESLELPDAMFLSEKSEFETITGKSVTVEKANLSVPARYLPVETLPTIKRQPRFMDFLQVRRTPALVVPQLEMGGTINNNETAAGAKLAESAITASITDTNLHVLGTTQPFTWQQAQIPGSVRDAEMELATDIRSKLNTALVTGSGNFNGIAETTRYTLSGNGQNSYAVSATDSVLDAVSAAAARSATERDEWPDFILCSATNIHRMQTEANSNSRYMPASSPERRIGRAWSMPVVLENGVGNNIYLGYSSDFVIYLHSSGFQMTRGTSADDFEKIQERIRVFVAAQLRFRYSASLQRLVVAQ